MTEPAPPATSRRADTFGELINRTSTDERHPAFDLNTNDTTRRNIR